MLFHDSAAASRGFLEKTGALPSNTPLTSIENPGALAQAIVDTIREPLLVLDKDLCVALASRSFYKKFNMNREDVEGRPVYALGEGQWNIPEFRSLLETIVPQDAVMEAYEVDREFVGIGRRTMLLNARKVFFEESSHTTILLAIEDITERRAAEREMKDLLREKEMLLQEMQHRVANSLQIIASILLLKARTVQSEETRLHLQDAHQRVMSIAAMQQQLQPSRHREPIEIGPYLTRLCDSLAASMIGDSRPISVKVQVDGGEATSSEAVSIGLIVTELVINALKHASFDRTAGGQIVVTYGAAESNWRLTVSDNGIGQPADPQVKNVPGLGTSIVEALAKQLDACVETSKSPCGTTVSISHTVDVVADSAAAP
jgi:chemotaxis protein methyltransferase CheR